MLPTQGCVKPPAGSGRGRDCPDFSLSFWWGVPTYGSVLLAWLQAHPL